MRVSCSRNAAICALSVSILASALLLMSFCVASAGLGLLGAAGKLLEPVVAGCDLLLRRRQLLPLGGEVALEPGDLRRQLPALGFGALQPLRQQRRILPQLVLGALFERQQSRQRVDLMLQFVQGRVAPGQRRRQIELAGGKDQQDEDDHHQQLRQGVDKARPDVDAVGRRAFLGAIGHRRNPAPRAQRPLSSARAAMVRARMRISLRTSCMVWARPCARSSERRAI